MNTPLAYHQRAANTLESGRVVRYHAVPSVGTQTVGLHAWGVGILCLYITQGKASRHLLAQALLHDAAELFTGDVPFTVKRDHPEVKTLFRELEIVAHENLVLPEAERLSEHDEAVLKLCDTLEGLIWCRKTETTGPVRDRWVAALDRAFEKFTGVLSQAEVDRAQNLILHWEPSS